jgi:hypothetical protein
MIHLETVQNRIAELEALWQRKHDAAESYKNAIEAVAESAHCDPSALRAYVNARMRDKVAELQTQQEQLSLMLESTP